MNRITKGLARATVVALLAGAAMVGLTATANAYGPLSCYALEWQYQNALKNRNHYRQESLYYATLGNQLMANFLGGYERHWGIVLSKAERC